MSDFALKLFDEIGVERDVAHWEVCKGVCEQLEAYRPLDPGPAPLLLRAHSTCTLIDEIGKDHNLAVALGSFRAHVTEIEATNARRLSVVAGVMFDLDEMLERAERPEMIRHMQQQLMFFLRGAWRLALPDEPRNVRLWAQRATRRYDLLPREWREL